MLMNFYEYLANRPALLRAMVAVLWRIGCSGLVAGVIAAVVNAILGVVMAKSGGAGATLEQLYPGLPTWWIPQSPLGVAFYLGLMLVAYLLNELARELRRLHRC